jgi:hypothetical protein
MNRLLLVLVCGMLFLSGCGGDRPTAPASGTVKMNGKPLANASLTFQPIGGGMASTGITDTSGRYTLNFLYSEDEGAIVGTHNVIIRTHKKAANTEDTSNDRADPSARDPIPRRYNDATELTMEVPADGTDSADFDLKSP